MNKARVDRKSFIYPGLVSLALFPICQTGCAQEELVSVSASEDQLYGLPDQGATYWNGVGADGVGAGAPAVIDVCWGKNATAGKFGDGSSVTHPDFPGFATISRWWREAVENSWGRAAWIQFRGWGTCAGDSGTDSGDFKSNPGKLFLYFGDNISAGSACFVGKRVDNATPCWVSPDGANNFRAVWQSYGIHEVGHALGFIHEQVRPDNWSGTPPAPHTCVNRAVNENGPFTGGIAWNSDGASTYVDKESVDCYDQAGGYQLSAGDVMGVQKIYGRKPGGSIVGYGGHAAAIAGGTTTLGNPIIAWDSADQWHFNFKQSVLPGASIAAGLMATDGTAERCWGIAGGVVSDSTPTPVISWPCTNDQNFQFPAFDMRWLGVGNMCVVASAAAPGATLSIQRCGSGSPERWDFFRASGQIRLNGTSLCVATSGSDPVLGELPSLQPCVAFGSATQTFDFATHHEIRQGGLCAAVFGGLPLAGSAVGLWDGCGNKLLHEQFNMNGRLMAMGQCAAWSGDLTTSGTPLEVRACQPAPAPITQPSTVPPFTPQDPQEWDIYW